MINKEQVLNNYYDIFKFIPVNWKNKESIFQFKIASEKYSKAWSKLLYDEQGWVSEQIGLGK